MDGPKASPIFPVGFECGDLLPPKRFAWHGGSFKSYSSATAACPARAQSIRPQVLHAQSIVFPADFYS